MAIGMRSFGWNLALVTATSAAIGLSLVACGSDSNGGSPEAGTGGGDNGGAGSGGKANGGSAGSGAKAGAGGTAAGAPGAGGSSGTGGAAGGAGGAKGGAGGATGGSSGSGGKQVDGGPDGCVPSESLTPPTVPDAIKVPAGATLVHHFHATGTQNYTCTATPNVGDGGGDAGATYAYNPTSVPEATLVDSCNTSVIHHFAGPTWQNLADSSSVKGTKVAASAVTNSIPQLLLQAVSTTGTGMLSSVTYIQRLDTTGGVMPDNAGCTAANVNSVAKVPYTANYYFYTGPNSADAGKD